MSAKNEATSAAAAAETCGECGAAIPPGEQAFIRGSTILCQNCWSKETTPRPVWLKCPVCASEMRNVEVGAHFPFVRYLLCVLGLSPVLGGISSVGAAAAAGLGGLAVGLFVITIPLSISFWFYSWGEAFRKKKVHRCLVCEYTVRAE